jgi:hypothetical protein
MENFELSLVCYIIYYISSLSIDTDQFVACIPQVERSVCLYHLGIFESNHFPVISVLRAEIIPVSYIQKLDVVFHPAVPMRGEKV